MKFVVEHDESGHLFSVVVQSGTTDEQLALRPKTGRHIAELDATEIAHFEDVDGIQRVRGGYRVESTNGGARLVRKGSG